MSETQMKMQIRNSQTNEEGGDIKVETIGNKDQCGYQKFQFQIILPFSIPTLILDDAQDVNYHKSNILVTKEY